jgi:hypothetical protein
MRARPQMRFLPALALALAVAGTPAHAAREDRSGALTFETCGAAGHVREWDGSPSGPRETLFLDSTVVHGGRYAGRIEREGTSRSSFSSYALQFPVDFPGDTLELRGWIKLRGVSGMGGLWQRQDGRSGMLEFDNMRDRPLTGTVDWTEVRVALPLDRRARTVHVGALLVGQGTLWLDDLRLFVDGRPIAEAPERVREKTVLETDTTFAAGSGITTTRVTPVQLDNLVVLAKTWGFLKYHHPAIVTGRRHWDYDLFRVLPRVLAARDRGAAQRALAAWVDSLGAVPACAPCAADPTGRPIVPRLGWLADRAPLGEALGARLRHIHANRPVVDEQFFVGLHPNVQNPDFSGEPPHFFAGLPDAGYRLLALFRFWNIVEYWFPYRDVMAEDWDAVLRASIPPVLGAATEDDYTLALLGAVARAHDGHANLWSGLDVRPPRGSAQVPVTLRFVEGKAVVTGYSHPVRGPASGLEVGDAIVALDATPVDTLIARWRPLYAASNEAARLLGMAHVLTRGAPGPLTLALEREGRRFEHVVERVPTDSLLPRAGATHDLRGETFRRLSDDVAYLKLSSVKVAETASYVDRAAGARCLVIDIRNYPSEFVVFALGQHLVRDTTAFARFTKGDLSNPGAFDWTEPVTIRPLPPHFEGRVAILVDEVSLSQAEYTSMAFRAAPGAIVVGSATAGADGNVSPIPLPGRQSTMISGIGVFYPDKRPTQRVGIVPDVEARPTIAGIRAGRDEVLEAAVRAVLGREMSEVERAAARAGGR